MSKLWMVMKWACWLTAAASWVAFFCAVVAYGDQNVVPEWVWPVLVWSILGGPVGLFWGIAQDAAEQKTRRARRPRADFEKRYEQAQRKALTGEDLAWEAKQLEFIEEVKRKNVPLDSDLFKEPPTKDSELAELHVTSSLRSSADEQRPSKPKVAGSNPAGGTPGRSTPRSVRDLDGVEHVEVVEHDGEAMCILTFVDGRKVSFPRTDDPDEISWLYRNAVDKWKNTKVEMDSDQALQWQGCVPVRVRDKF